MSKHHRLRSGKNTDRTETVHCTKYNEKKVVIVSLIVLPDVNMSINKHVFLAAKCDSK